jgi:hypothetical protein
MTDTLSAPIGGSRSYRHVLSTVYTRPPFISSPSTLE